VRDLPDRPIALTLFRSFLKTVLTDGNEGGQIQGRHEFEYRIVPLAGPPDVARLTRLGQRLAAGLRVVPVEYRDLAAGKTVRPARQLPVSSSFLKIESEHAVVTAVHRRMEREDATVRLFNPTDRPIEVQIGLDHATRRTRTTDLAGRAGDPLPSTEKGTSLTLKPKQIATIQWAD